ncbi:hypothetical protein M758_3G135800 [Ceratodon purpureus]|nr:hypothetical protein M758_3G135800 [Ceratodon purpureus]
MDVDEFDDIFSFHWHNQSDALSNVSIGFPVELSTVEIFLNEILDINEDITVETCEDSAPVNKVASFPTLQIEATDRARQSPVGSDSGLEWIPPITCDDVVLLPTSINASVNTCVSNDDLRGQQGSCVTEETSPPAKVRKKQSSAARVSRKKIKTNDSQKPMKQIHSRDSNRLPAPEEHILRERKRRDEMAEKFKLLEQILPPQARRQKATIVEDTIKLVKSLQLRKDELLKRRAQMKLRLLNRNKTERSPQYPSSRSKGLHPFYKNSAIGMQFVMPSSTFDSSEPIDTGMPIILGYSAQCPIASAAAEINMTPLRIDTSNCRYLLQIHAQVSGDEILVEMLFRQYSPSPHTRVMQTVESMKLEVIRGSMQRSVPCGFIEFIITAKSQEEFQSRHQDIQSSARLLAGALQAAFSE